MTHQLPEPSRLFFMLVQRLHEPFGILLLLIWWLPEAFIYQSRASWNASCTMHNGFVDLPPPGTVCRSSCSQAPPSLRMTPSPAIQNIVDLAPPSLFHNTTALTLREPLGENIRSCTLLPPMWTSALPPPAQLGAQKYYKEAPSLFSKRVREQALRTSRDHSIF